MGKSTIGSPFLILLGLLVRLTKEDFGPDICLHRPGQTKKDKTKHLFSMDGDPKGV